MTNAYIYALSPKKFTKNLFKFCKECGLFEMDFANIFCEKCNEKLDYVDVPTFIKDWLDETPEKSVKSTKETAKYNHNSLFSPIKKAPVKCAYSPIVVHSPIATPYTERKLNYTVLPQYDNCTPYAMSFSCVDKTEYPMSVEKSLNIERAMSVEKPLEIERAMSVENPVNLSLSNISNIKTFDVTNTSDMSFYDFSELSDYEESGWILKDSSNFVVYCDPINPVETYSV